MVMRLYLPRAEVPKCISQLFITALKYLRDANSKENRLILAHSLEVPDLGASFGSGLLVGRFPRLYRTPYGKRQGACLAVYISLISYKAIKIQLWGLPSKGLISLFISLKPHF